MEINAKISLFCARILIKSIKYAANVSGDISLEEASAKGSSVRPDRYHQLMGPTVLIFLPSATDTTQLPEIVSPVKIKIILFKMEPANSSPHLLPAARKDKDLAMGPALVLIGFASTST